MRYLADHILLSAAIGCLSFYMLRISSCSSASSRAPGNQNLSHIYRAEQDILHPRYTVFHRSNTISELHFKINSKELLYSKQAGNENFTARFSVHYRLISSYETKDIIDSATVFLTDRFSNSTKDIIGKMDFNAIFTNTYLLQVNFTDLNRNVTSKYFVTVDKLDHSTRQNFLALSAETMTPLFRDHIGKDEKFLVRFRKDDVTLYVRYYHRDFPLPSPPYSASNMIPFEYKADSLFTLESNFEDTSGMTFSKPGFYHIQSDTTTKDGLTLFRFDDDFPFVKRPEHLLEPLRYVTTKQEYEAMAYYKNPKLPVDSFWVYAGGSHDRARELVRKYYNRVQRSNEYFSSYLEGWKTDRGLIYVIYGPPNVVYKGSESENWVYGEENNFNSLTFTFLRVINPFTDNDYRLERSQVFKTSWLNSVEMWRQGRVYAEK